MGVIRCKNCGHLIIIEVPSGEEKSVYKHKQGNHSFYCPCRKPQPQ